MSLGFSGEAECSAHTLWMWKEGDAPECGGGLEAAGQASHWLNSGTPPPPTHTPVVLPSPRFEI